MSALPRIEESRLGQSGHDFPYSQTKSVTSCALFIDRPPQHDRVGGSLTGEIASFFVVVSPMDQHGSVSLSAEALALADWLTTDNWPTVEQEANWSCLFANETGQPKGSSKLAMYEQWRSLMCSDELQRLWIMIEKHLRR